MWIAALLTLQLVAPPLEARQTGVFQSARLRESSGVAVSRAHPGVVWTHNDSGDGPYVYATDTTGADRGALRVPRALAFDWEDMALGPCPDAAGECMYFADTGDNFERRLAVTIYAVAEPTPPSGPADTLRLTDQPAALSLIFPDGPADVEAMYVAPDGSVYLVNKGRNHAVRLYRVPRSAWGADSLVTAEQVQDLPIAVAGSRSRLVTGAAMSADGAHVVVRTYTDLYQFDRLADGQLHDRLVCSLGRMEELGEAVAFLDRDRFVLTSEAGRRSGTLHIVRCP